MDEADYPPLLDLGFHPMSPGELRALCVKPFPLSKTRPGIMQGIDSLVERLIAERVYGELWADGSFLTNKIDPRDVDMVLLLRGEAFEGYSDAQRTAVDWLLYGGLKDSLKVDSYVDFEYPDGHPRHAEGVYMRAYWTKQYGFDSTGVPARGIAVIRYMPIPPPTQAATGPTARVSPGGTGHA
jgi:hypothetical protein